MGDKKTKEGTIVCTRIVKFGEISPYINDRTIKEAVDYILKNEQDEWKNKNIITNEDGTCNADFFRNCFPHWKFVLEDIEYTPKEAADSNIVGDTRWNVELRVEYDAKLKAYQLLKENKDNQE